MTYSTLKRGGPLRQRSEKRVKEDAAFSKVREAVMERDGHRCQFGRFVPDPWACAGPLDPHHIVTRARDKTLALDPDNLVTLCRRHHDVVHAYPANATHVGLLKSAPLLSPQPNQGNRR